MNENMQYMLLGSVLLCLYLGYRLNKKAQETNVTVLDILKENKEVAGFTGLSMLGIFFYMNKNEDGMGLNLFGQDKLCNNDFYEIP